MRYIAILGSTGSIGTQAISVIKNFEHRFKIKALAAEKNLGLLKKQIEELKPEIVCVGDEKACNLLKGEIKGIEIVCGEEGLSRIVDREDVDTVLFAISGIIGMEAFKRSMKKGKRIAISTKELIVSYGELFKEWKKQFDAEIIPVDSEHSAIFQCLESKDKRDVKRIILTASGGPFLDKEIKDVKKEDVLTHPVWEMGVKTTVDSATMMNKCLEIIEAHYLFDVEPEKIEVVIHPQSIVHSMVEFKDGSVIAQLAVPDMRLPILYALSYPERFDTNLQIDFGKVKYLEFRIPNREKFPAIDLAYEVLEKKHTYPAVLAAADEKAVELFLQDRLKFEDIVDAIKKCIDAHTPLPPTEENIKKSVDWAKNYMEEYKWSL